MSWLDESLKKNREQVEKERRARDEGTYGGSGENDEPSPTRASGDQGDATAPDAFEDRPAPKYGRVGDLRLKEDTAPPPGKPDAQFADVKGGSSTKEVGAPLATKKRALARVSKPPPVESDKQGMTADAPAADPLGDIDKANAKDASDLAAAQTAAAERMRDAQATNMIWRGFGQATGTGVDEAAARARIADANRPVEDYAQRRQVEGENLKRGAQRYDLAQDVRMDNPNDPLAKQAAALAVARGMMKPGDAAGFTLRTWKYMDAGASFQQAKEKAAQDSRDKAAERAVQMRGQDMTLAGKLMDQKGQNGEVKSGRAATIGKQLAQLRAARHDILMQADQAKQTGIVSHLLAKAPMGIGAWLAPQAAATDANAHVLTATAAGALEGGAPTQGRMGSMAPSTAVLQGGSRHAAVDAAVTNLVSQLDARENALRQEAHGMGLKVGPGGEIFDQGGAQLFGGEGGTIRVREKRTGQTGTLPASEFDPAQYERI